MPADVDSFKNPDRYEAFTCFQEGSRAGQSRVDRDGTGAVRYSWKQHTPAAGPDEQATLIKAGVAAGGERCSASRTPTPGGP